MSRPLPDALHQLLDRIEARAPLGADAPPEAWTRAARDGGSAMYQNTNERLNIAFTVDRLDFPAMEAMDPRVLRIPPGKNNELHRHAHESLFVVLAGAGEVRIGEAWRPVQTGDVAFVPRWILHQTRNPSPDTALVILAITDFGLTSAVLGDDDRRTRLAAGGADAPTG